MCTRTSVKTYFIKLVTSFYKQNKQFIVIGILFSIYAKFRKASHLKLFIATELWVKFTSWLSFISVKNCFGIFERKQICASIFIAYCICIAAWDLTINKGVVISIKVKILQMYVNFPSRNLKIDVNKHEGLSNFTLSHKLW